MINPKRNSTNIRRRDLVKECWTLFCIVVWAGFSITGTYRAFTQGIVGIEAVDTIVSWIFVLASITLVSVAVSVLKDIKAFIRTRFEEAHVDA